MYTVQRDEDGKVVGVVRDGRVIPADERNPHWREFQAWNSKQAQPIQLVDQPVTRRKPKATARLLSAVRLDLTDQQRQRLTELVIVDLLQRHPQAARAIGIDIDGDEPE